MSENRKLDLGPGHITRDSSPEEKRAYHNEYMKKWRTHNWEHAHEYMAEYKRRQTYKIHKAEFTAMLVASKGLCGICRTPFGPPTKGRGAKMDEMTVDHDHATGKVRGLICGGCNHGLGNFKDDPERLTAAIAYLQACSEVS